MLSVVRVSGSFRSVSRVWWPTFRWLPCGVFGRCCYLLRLICVCLYADISEADAKVGGNLFFRLSVAVTRFTEKQTKEAYAAKNTRLHGSAVRAFLPFLEGCVVFRAQLLSWIITIHATADGYFQNTGFVRRIGN